MAYRPVRYTRLLVRSLAMEFYDKKQLADLLHVDARTVERWVKAGELVAPLRLGRKALWRKGDIEEWVASRIAATPSGSCGAGGASDEPAVA